MLNFGGIHKEIGHFNLPVLYGPPMSGKTLTASCVALITGILKNQISSRNTQAFLSDCFAISTFPSVWDDPTKEQEVKQVCIDLGNAAFRGKFKEDAKTPLSGCLVTANFSLSEIEKYYSRVCLIPFEKVKKVTHVGEGPALEKRASAALPTLINFAHGIRREDVHDIVEVLRTSNIRDLRILEGVAIPCMLAKKILSTCDLPHEELLDFCGRILNYHTTRGSLPQEVENGNSSSGTALQKVFMMAKDKEVSAHIRITADKLYVRVKEFDQKR
ncbi:uncharacterized protein LOC132741940 [Ruditapes philippinarum]|uniref:uncharacterized protein LOC132741940 n=1 Tax=Ruditapes philippinarum TaxID=129788 RepID=UPI00295B3DDF|nr:uncharacterized protein LOC132741940 [Ruditapes philippinarum]